MGEGLDFGFLGDGWRQGVRDKRQPGPLCLPGIIPLFKKAGKAWDPSWSPEEKRARLTEVAAAQNQALAGFSSWEKRQAIVETLESHHIELPFERAFERLRIPAMRKIEGEAWQNANASWKKNQAKPLDFPAPRLDGTADYFALYAPVAHYGYNYGIYFRATSILDFLADHPAVPARDFVLCVAVHELFHAFVEEALGAQELYHGMGRSGYCRLEEAAATLASFRIFRGLYPQGEAEGGEAASGIRAAIFLRLACPDAPAERGLPGYGEYWRLEGASINRIILALSLGAQDGIDWSRGNPLDAITGHGGESTMLGRSGSACCAEVSLPKEFPRTLPRRDWKPLWAYYLANRLRDLVPMYFDFYNL